MHFDILNASHSTDTLPYVLRASKLLSSKKSSIDSNENAH